jgi:uncharacterized protein
LPPDKHPRQKNPAKLNLEWDDTKNRTNIRKHGIDFADATQMFEGFLLTLPDTREDYGEERWQGVGTIQGRVVVIVFSQPRPDTIRVISLRKASRHERKQFENIVKEQLEES